jgi:hypothetical protein
LNPSILKTERPPVTCARSNRYCGRCNTPDRAAASSRESGFVHWHIAEIVLQCKIRSPSGMADIEQASPFN